MNIYAVSNTYGHSLEYDCLQIWCARDKEHLESMIIESEKRTFELFDDDHFVCRRLSRGIHNAVIDAKVLTNESAGMLAGFTT